MLLKFGLVSFSQDGDRGLLVAAPAPLGADLAETPAVKSVASNGPSWEELKVGDRIHPCGYNGDRCILYIYIYTIYIYICIYKHIHVFDKYKNKNIQTKRIRRTNHLMGISWETDPNTPHFSWSKVEALLPLRSTYR